MSASNEDMAEGAPLEPLGTRDMTGIEFLREVVSGTRAGLPMWQFLGIRLEEAEQGRTLFSITPESHHSNSQGMAHGGLAATLIDSAASCAVITILGVGDWSTTVDLNVKYVRALRETGEPVRCEGRLVHAGRRMATAEGRVFDATGRLLAHGGCTCMIVRAE